MSAHQCEEWQMQESATGRGKYCAECGRHTDQDLFDRSLTDMPPADGDPQDSGAVVVDRSLTLQRLAELRVTATAATEGEWGASGSDVFAGDGSGSNPGIAEVWRPADAAHIAAFDRDTALTLLGRVEELQAAVERVNALHVPGKLADVWGFPTDPEEGDTLVCATCTHPDLPGWEEYPCPDVQALQGLAAPTPAETAVARIRARHQPVSVGPGMFARDYCAVCVEDGGMDGALKVLYPCPEIQALESDDE